MSIRGYNVLAMLRRGRRAIALGVLPALLATLLTSAACPAMSAAPATTDPHSAHYEHAAHEHHGHHDSAPPALPTGDCPHCPGGHAAGNVAAADCDIAATALAGPAQPPPNPGFALTHASFAPLATSAVPPLIGAPPRTEAAPLSSVPLHIRHCVLLT